MNSKHAQSGDQRATVAVITERRVQLRVQNGPEAGRRVTVEEFPCRLGRGGDSRVVLADPDDPPTLSREHVTLSRSRRHAEELVVTDHSRNGTCVGGRWLASGEADLLEAGETLQLGPTLRLLRESGVGEARGGHSSTGEATGAQSDAQHREGGRGGAPVPCGGSESAVGDLRAFLTAPETLRAAWRRVALNRGAAGPDNVTVQDFARNAERRLDTLRQELVRGRYAPLPPRLFAAPKRRGGVRTIAILSVQDRIVQQALHTALQPHLEPSFPDCSYAYRPGVCAHHALRRVDSLLRAGQTWVAETDIAGFFDAIAHTLLLEKLTARIPDPFTLSLVARCLAVGAKTAGRGIPQGAATSPLFSNLYLAEFDAAMLAGGWNPVRYGDDLLFPVGARALAQAALASAEGMLRSRLHLSLKPEKTGIVSLAEGFTFLGFRFTEAGRQAAPEAVAQLAQRLEESSEETAPAVVRGWNNYYKKEEGGRREAKEEDGRRKEDSNASSSTSGSNKRSGNDIHPSSFLLPPFVPRFLELFGGREDFHARQSGQGNRSRFTACTGGLSAEEVGRHLAGEETFATYLIRRDGMVRHLVLDMDAARGAGRPGAVEAVEAEEGEALRQVHVFALDLARVCRAMGVPASLEDSGRRGRHLWIFFSEGVAPERARRLARLLALRAGFPREGVRLEILPRHTDWPGPELGDAVKLPLGVHPLTGRRCFLLDAEGEPVADAAVALERIRTISAAEVEALIAALSRLQSAGEASLSASAPSETEDAVGRLVGGCSVIWGLVARAQQTGHLRHTHQLILLYTAGRLGPEGAAFLHRTIAHCRNYDAEICQGYIDRLDRDRPALGCRRIREWLEEEGETGLCTCPASRRTPLELTEAEGGQGGSVGEAKPRRKPQTPPARPPLPAEVQPGLWQEVADDLFRPPELRPRMRPPTPDFGGVRPPTPNSGGE